MPMIKREWTGFRMRYGAEAMKKILRRHSRGIVVILLIIFLVAGLRQLWTDPQISLLVNEGGAEWIRFPSPFQLPIHLAERLLTRFRCRLEIRQIPDSALLTLRAMKEAHVFLDGRFLFRTPEDPEKWRKTHRIDLRPWLTQGSHELLIEVAHSNGYPALLAYCKSLDIFSGEGWEANRDGLAWLPALSVDRISPLSISRTFPRSDQALRILFPLFLSVFVLFFFWSLRSDDRVSPSWFDKVHLPASAVRWLVLGGWLLMGVNNFWKIPHDMGMDVKGHLQYILYVAEYGRIPLATEGWQMFQPPLYYLLTAAVYNFFLGFFDMETVVRILKILPFLCGMAQVEICYRVLRNAYPGRESLQGIGILLGGLLPINIYMSQSLGNEPLVGCLTALLILLACRIFSGVSRATREIAILMGFTLGLALLTKVTAILIIPPLIFFVSAEILRTDGSAHERIRSAKRFMILFLGIALIIAGWYYLRNRIELGRFFIGGWDAFRDIVWWQDPGYRTLRQCYIFGESISYPVFSSIYGFWDAIYSSFWVDGYLSAYTYNRPPWNYGFMLSGVWLSLLPSTAIMIGFFVTGRVKGGPLCRMLRFSAYSIVFYLAAIFYMFLTVPILSSAKATYALGLIPCFALIGTAGFEVLMRRRFVKAAVHGLFACWAVGSYVSYFII
jgi:hypothetical protein